jgi:dephospho-CoA kinase
MRVIGTVGLPGSGKGEFAAVAEEAGVPVVTMGDVVREACRERGLDPAEHHGAVARALREEDGPLAIARRSVPHVRAALEESGTVVVDGLRSGREASFFADEFGDAWTLVAVEAPFETRAERIETRDRDDTAAETLRERDARERGFGMDEAIAAADVTIENDGPLAAFREAARAVLAGERPAGATDDSDDSDDRDGSAEPPRSGGEGS